MEGVAEMYLQKVTAGGPSPEVVFKGDYSPRVQLLLARPIREVLIGICSVDSFIGCTVSSWNDRNQGSVGSWALNRSQGFAMPTEKSVGIESRN